MGEISSTVRLGAEQLERSGLFRRTSESLVREDAYFREVLDTLPAAVYITNADGLITYYNEAAVALWGNRPELGTGQWCGSWKLYWPDGKPMRHDECPMAVALKESRPLRGREAIAERPDGGRVPFIAYPSPLHDDSGTLIGAVNMLVEITDRKRAEEQQNLLVNEIKHRIKNTLATVQAIATQTFRGAPSVERQAFSARLLALARAQDLLTKEDWNRAPLSDIVGHALEAFQDKHRERVVIDGPDGLWLDAQNSSLLTIALHELATNAVKYGALSNEDGQVRVSWEPLKADQKNRLRLCWQESGGPPVKPPEKKGFGSHLIERALASGDGQGNFDFDPQGLVCTLEVAL